MQTQTINQRLKEIRTLLRFTQKDFSFALGVKPSYYSDLENSHRTITGKFIEKLNRLFGVSADWMYTGKGEISTTNSEFFMYPKSVPSDVPQNEFQVSEDEILAMRKRAKARISELKKDSEKLDEIVFPTGYFEENHLPIKYHFEKKLILDIKHNYNNINALSSSLTDLQIFEYIISSLKHHYFNRIDLQFHSGGKYFTNGIFDYEKYKDDYIKELKRLEPIIPALSKISKAIKVFYDEMKDFDTDNVIEGFYTGELFKTQ